MASASTHRGVAVLVVLLVVMAATASLVQADTCPTDISELEVCYGAVTSGGGDPNQCCPGCCTTIKGWGLDCLCSLVTQYGNNLPSGVNINEALALPEKCGMTVPTGYKCDNYNVPSTLS